MKSARDAEKQHEFTFLTNHSHVLVVLSRDTKARLRDVAAEVGITERAVQAIVKDLTDAKVLKVTKEGRRNVYTINRNAKLRHPVEAGHTVGQLLKTVM